MIEPAKLDVTKFKPKTVYVTYIASTRQEIWDALTRPEFTQQFFFGRTVEIDPEVGGRFVLRMPDGRIDVTGEVVAFEPPQRLAVTWTVDWNEQMRALPTCLVTYEIAQAGEAVRLTMTESHQWDVPDGLLAGGRMGWPVILSSLKSLLETGKPLSVKMEPPKEMIAALERLKQQ